MLNSTTQKQERSALREGWQRIPHSRSCGVLAWLTARSNSVQPDPMKQEQPWQGARPKKKQRGYNNPSHPHAPSEIMEMGKPKARTYQYDGNGNPVYYEESKSFRSMVWDEENRLRGINDNGKLHLYTYDHTGERAVKSSGESSTVVTNGLTSAVITHMDDYTAYVNPYFVVQKGRFTKHYFEGSSRIVSKLGEGTFVHKNTGIMAGGIDYIRQSAQMQEARDRYIKGSLTPPGPPTQHGIYASPEWTGQPYPSLGWQNIRQDQEPPEGWPRPPKFNEPGDVPGPPVQYGDPITPQTVKAGYGFVPNGIREKNLYYYHPDHLGSSSYITDREGRITQHTEYIAFGEVLFEEHSTSKTMPYLFNGKELDTETGLYYYGARYYDPRVSIFLNVDPLAEKTMTPYAYTNNNPIMLVDPTGMASEDWVKDKNGNIFWDSRVTNQEQAEKYWGKGVKHYAPNDYGYETDKGYVLLSSDRKWVRNGTEYTAPDMAGTESTATKIKNFISDHIILEASVGGSVGLQIGGKLGAVSGGIGAFTQYTHEGKFDFISGEFGSDIGKSNGRNNHFIEGGLDLGKIAGIGGELSGSSAYSHSLNDLLLPDLRMDNKNMTIGVGLTRRPFGHKKGYGDLNIQPEAKYTPKEKAINIGVGVKAIIGVEVNLKIGIK